MHVVKIYAIVVLVLFLQLESTNVLVPLLRQIGVLWLSLVVGWWASLGIKRLLSSRHKVSPDGLAVVVAGCDSEHGFVTASLLRRYGYYVLAGTQDVGGEMARGMEMLEVDVVELQGSNEGSVNDAYQDICDRLFKEEKRLHALVCNVGSAELGELEWVSDRALRHALDESLVATARLVNLFLPLLRESRSRVVICAGTSGRVPVPGAGAHSIVNAALIAFADCLRREMYKFKVQVTLVEPVWIGYRTPLSRMHSPGIVITEVLSDLSREVFEDYSLGYMNAFRNLWNSRATRWYMGPPHTLAACTCLAVNDRVALPVYTCGYAEEKAVNAVLERLPSPFADMVQCFLYQPFAKLRVWTESGDDFGRVPSVRAQIASPGLMQRLLHATLSPKPVPFRASEMTTPVRQLETLRAEHFASRDRTEDGSPQTKTHQPVMRLKAEALKPRRVQGHVYRRSLDAGRGQPSVCQGAKHGQTVYSSSPIHQVAPQAGDVPKENSDDDSSSDPTASPDVSCDSSNTASSTDVAREGSVHMSLPGDEKDSVVLLDIMQESQCDIVASTLASVQRSLRKGLNTPCPTSGSLTDAAGPAAQASPQERPPSLKIEQPLSPRSPYFRGVQPVARNVMEVISPPCLSDLASTPTSTTGEGHSSSPIDSAARMEVVSAPSEHSRHGSLLPDASGPPPNFLAARHTEYLRRHGMTSRADLETELIDCDQKDSPEDPPMPATGLRDQGSLSRRRSKKNRGDTSQH